MTSQERWRQIEALFHAACERPAAERAAFLEEQCAGHPDILQEVLSLIRAKEEAGAFLQKRASEQLDPEGFLLADHSLIGQKVGAYEITDILGEGGMGTVYLACRADEQFQQTVAVKVIQKGLQSEGIAQRFLTERQILASLRHPYIAQLLDGGMLEDGRPYFVMEYVEGTRVVEYCRNQALTFERRLRIFQKICAAVNHAHRNLVVHRDIKPGNILVTPEGIPKLLDFGIAKLLEVPQEGLPMAVTRTHVRLLTPEYASPEQIRGETITTATDVYSLGVLLYELLTGQRPFQLKDRPSYEIERIICEEAPAKPSTAVGTPGDTRAADAGKKLTAADRAGRRPKALKRKLKGDLDNIILKALQKAPERRYGSVQEFSADVESYLSGLPVKARGDHFAYRSLKFIKRHKVGVFSAMLIVLSLVTGLVLALWQNRIARVQRDLAFKAAQTMVHELAQSLSEMTGPTESRLGLLRSAAEVYDEISEGFLSTLEMKRQNAEAHGILAKTYATLGDSANALAEARLAEQQARRLAAGTSAEIRDKILLASALVTLGDVRVMNQDEVGAQRAFDEAIALAGHAANDGAHRNPALRWLYLALSRKADRLFYTSQLDSAALLYRKANQIIEELERAHPEQAEFYNLHATSIERLADVLYYSGKVEASCEKYRQALQVRQSARELAPANVNILRALAISMQNVGWCAAYVGDLDSAVSLYQQGVKVQTRLLQQDSSNTILIENAMGGVGELANAYLQKGETRKALETYRSALDLGENAIARNLHAPALFLKQANLAQLYATALIRLERFAEALLSLNRAQNALESLIARSPENTEHRRSLVYVITTRGDLARKMAHPTTALQRYQQALQLLQPVAETTEITQDREQLAVIHYKLARTYQTLKDRDSERAALRKARGIIENLQQTGQLDPASETLRTYLPKIQQALARTRK